MANSASRSLPPAFYARLFCSAEQQAKLDAADALYREISSIPQRVSDVAVARAKLAWWRNELTRSTGGSPGHPLSRDFFERVSACPAMPLWFDAILDGVEERISGLRPDSEAALARYCYNAMGGYMELLASLTQSSGPEPDPQTREFASLVGAGAYLSSQAIACAAHGIECRLASAIPASPGDPEDTIKPILFHASDLLDKALTLPNGGRGLIYHHAILRIHHRLTRKALSQAKLETGKPIYLNGFRMLACAWKGARASAARSPRQDH